jgi:glutathione S-transferase
MTLYLVHSIPGSPYGRAVCATLEEKGLPWRIAPLGPGTLKNPEHRARHPFGRVPVLEKDGQLLYETQAILRHLDRVCPAPPMTPSAPADAARMDQVIGVIDAYFFPGASRIIVFERLVGPALMGHSPNEERIAAAMPDAEIVFAELARLLGDRTWFGGETFSLADVLAGAHLELFARIPEWHPLTARHRNLKQWLDRVEQRPAMQATRWEALAERAKHEAVAA